MPVNEPDDSAVALGEPHGGSRGRSFETGKAGWHRATLPEMKRAKQTGGLVIEGKCEYSCSKPGRRVGIERLWWRTTGIHERRKFYLAAARFGCRFQTNPICLLENRLNLC